MLSGKAKHSVDAHNRLFIPAKMREALGSTFCIAKSVRGNYLAVYSLEEWEKYLAPIREKARSLSEGVLRFLNGGMAQVTPDSQGRIVLPQELLEFASIQNNVVIVGCGDRAEIWDVGAYEKYEQEFNIEEMRAALEALGL